MHTLATHTTPPPPAPWLLTPPLVPPTPKWSEEQADLLLVLANVTGAPTAIPPSLWEMPLPSLTLASVSPLLGEICNHLATTLPLMPEELWEGEVSEEVLYYFQHIPVTPLGVDSCNGCVFGFGPVVGWVAELAGYTADFRDSPLPDAIPPHFEVGYLAPALRKTFAGRPLSALADIVDVLNHDTGTFFFDACPSCWNSFAGDVTEWSDENLTWLQEDALRAQALQERIDLLEEWVAADQTRMAEVWQALLTAFVVACGTDVAMEPRQPQTLAELWAGEQDEGDGDAGNLPQGVVLL